MLRPAVTLLAIAGWMAACGSAPPSPSPDAEAAVVARWIADDESVVALNVVLGPRTDRGRLPELSRALREQHPRARVVVTFFSEAAGEERFVIGHVPTDGGPITNARPSTAIATFDYPRPTPTATAGAP